MKKLVMLVITMILAVGAFSGTEVEAASKKATAKKAKKAYANYLQTEAKSVLFLKNLNTIYNKCLQMY